MTTPRATRLLPSARSPEQLTISEGGVALGIGSPRPPGYDFARAGALGRGRMPAGSIRCSTPCLRRRLLALWIAASVLPTVGCGQLFDRVFGYEVYSCSHGDCHHVRTSNVWRDTFSEAPNPAENANTLADALSLASGAQVLNYSSGKGTHVSVTTDQSSLRPARPPFMQIPARRSNALKDRLRPSR
jgi:hypothetical protein